MNREMELTHGVPKVLWCYWEGSAMSGNRLLSFQLLKKNIGVPVILVTPENLPDFLVNEHPFPDVFKDLSIVHRSDYVRAYLMHHYGGAWHDIKATECDFSQSWQAFADENVWMIGRPEVSGGAAQVFDLAGRYMPDYFQDLIAVPAWIARPKTKLSQEILEGIENFIQEHAVLLRQHPARHPREKFEKAHNFLSKAWNYLKKTLEGRNPFYPIPWTLFGNFYHPAVLKYKQHIVKTLPVDQQKNAGIKHRG